MIYTWKCSKCDTRVEVERTVADIDVAPGVCPGCYEATPHLKVWPLADWKRVIGVTPVMFEKAYDSGVFERIWKHPNLS